MDLTGLNVTEIIELYSQSIQELKRRHVLRTNNVLGDLGEYLVLDWYAHSASLPNLVQVPIGTQNINAIGQDGKRYAIKSTSGNVTGVFYGLEPPGSKKPDNQVFEYVIICKFDNDYVMQAIYQLDWKSFLEHKRWHSRMQAWNLTLTQKTIAASTVIYERNGQPANVTSSSSNDEEFSELINESDTDVNLGQIPFSWEKTKKVNHAKVKDEVADYLQKKHGIKLNKLSNARYESDDKMIAVFVMSASYSDKNQEYWYSIADANLPWLRNYPSVYVVFALGSSKNVLEFPLVEFEKMLSGCLHTDEDIEKNKTAHFHVSFSVEDGRKVYFKQKKPTRDFIDVSEALL